ncbi:MAG: hypothetical protein IJZ79_03430 [Bacilli bacterium]|nr:hypothetical protein [Bacilli bacterium]MBQ8218780.1 hypothetical protein [Bacilli bacterium]
MARDLITQARDLKSKHRGKSFNVNYATVNNIRKIAEHFTNHKLINVENISSIKRVIQYMIAAKMVGFDRLYFDLCEITGHELDSFCEDIEIEDNCYDGFDTAVERHLYRANPRIYEYLKTKHIRILDGGLVKYRKTCSDIFLPDYRVIIDVSTYKAELELKELIENSDEEVVNFAKTYKLKSIGKFEYLDNKLTCTGEGGDPVDIDNTDIYDCIVDSNYDIIDFNLNHFIMDGTSNGLGKVQTYRTIKIDQLHQHDQILLLNGIVYHDEEQKCYMIVGPYKLVHLTKYDNLNQMSLVYSFNDKYGKHIDMIRLNNLSCDTVEWDDWCEDHSENSVVNGYVYLVKGRTIITKIANKDHNVDFKEVTKLLESV